MNNKELLKRLAEEMTQVVQSDRNQAIGKLYRQQPPWGRDCWRGIPLLGTSTVPFTVDPEKQLWSQITGFDVSRYWTDPYVHLEGHLKMNLHKHNVFKENTFITGDLSPWFGVVFELSLFGIEIVWREDRDPWIAHEPLLKSYDQIDGMEMPDFFKSGLMPKVHQFYETFQEVAGEGLNIVFPHWVRGPVCIAMHLRGMQRLLMDMVVNPKGVHKLMRFVTDVRKEWMLQRSKHLNIPMPKGKLYNDEVDCPTMSPKQYQEFVLPYEQEISEFQGGIVYFHSCGNLTPFLDLIQKIPNLDLLHISPWTDLAKAVEMVSPEIALDINLNPAADVIQASPEQMRQKLQEIMQLCQDKVPYSIRADAFEIINDAQGDHQKILEWCEIAREITNQDQLL